MKIKPAKIRLSRPIHQRHSASPSCRASSPNSGLTVWSAALLDEPTCEWRIALAWRRHGYLSHAARAWRALGTPNLLQRRPGLPLRDKKTN